MGVKQNYRMIQASRDEIVTRSLPSPKPITLEEIDDFIRRCDGLELDKPYKGEIEAFELLSRIDALEPMEEVQREVFNCKQPIGWDWLSKPVGLALTAAVAIIALYVGIGL